MDKSVKELHQERIKMWDESMANHFRYIDQNTGLFDRKYTQCRSCPVCESQDEVFMFHKAGGTYVKCAECGMVYLNPVFKDDYLTEYYMNNHTVQSETVENDPTGFYRRIYSKGLDAIGFDLQKGKDLLDIGCSSGFFLDLARERGFDTYGVELNEAEMNMAREKGHKVYNELLDAIDFSTKFDAVTLWDVFEHIKDGKKYIETIKRILKEGGVLFMQIPSADSLAAKIMHEKCNMFDGLEHVNLYGVETIKRLAKSCGMEIISMETVISEIGVLNNYLQYEDPYLGSVNIKDEIPGLIDEKMIHERLLGYKLQIVMREKEV